LAKELRAQLEGQNSQQVDPMLAAAEKQTDAASIIDALLQARVQLRAEKAWKLSDLIRDWLTAQGVQVEDSAGGSSWRWE
jgi:cysteinyl-tRNA synthetase